MKLPKTLFLLYTILIINITGFAQKKTYDIVSYSPPKDWTEQQDNGNVSYSRIDGASWAQIAIYQHRQSVGDIQTDFDKDWNELVAQGKTISSPEKTEPQSAEGWTVMSGSGLWQYNGANVASVLTIYSNSQVCVAVLCNSTAMPYMKMYQSLIGSIDLDASAVSETNSEPEANANTNTNHTSIVGTWIINSAETNGVVNHFILYTGGYFRKEYTFKSDGTYFYSFKTWSVHIDNILYGNETGTWSVNGDKLTLSPTKGMSGEWEKTNNDSNEWGSLVKKNNWKLEKTTYQFNIHNDGVATIIRLDNGSATERDGAYTNKYFSYVLSDQLLIDYPPGFKSGSENKQLVSSTNENNSTLNTNSITGLWTNYILETTGYYINAQPQYTAGYLRKEYQFNADGTYTFRNKQWLTKSPDILFIYEAGTYVINGNQLTLIPIKGKSGFWGKTSSSKEWGDLKKYVDYSLEKTTYNFEIITDSNYSNSIILKPGKPTTRDGGKFNAAGDHYEFRYSFRDLESLVDNPPGFRMGLRTSQ